MKLTAEKKRKAKHAMQKRLRGEDPFPVPQEKISGPVVPSMTRGAGTKVAFVLANQLEAGLTAVSVQTGNQRCHTAELVVTDTRPLAEKRGRCPPYVSVRCYIHHWLRPQGRFNEKLARCSR